MEIKLKEVEWFSLVSMVLGIAIFIVLCFWDTIAGDRIRHNEGYGYLQILGMAGSGLYSMWAAAIRIAGKIVLDNISEKRRIEHILYLQETVPKITDGQLHD